MNTTTINNRATALLSLLALASLSVFSQSTGRNYVKETLALDESGSNSIQSVQYYNGLGYPTVSVATAGTNGGTACTMTTYDALGREERRYAPVPASGLGYMTENDIRSRGYFYQDNSCFTQYHYDALDRVTAVDIAGDKWRQDGRQDRTEYHANTLSDEVLHFEAPDDGSYSLVNPENTSFRYYPSGSLSKVISYDADDKGVTVFTDLQGKKILERTDAGDTYYVYNSLGQLRFVLTPAFNEKSRSKAMFAYEYRYDNRGRTEWKKLPGTGHIQYWYDDADRVMAMQDAMMRNSSKYRFFVYDNFGRVAIQGLCSQYTHHDNVLAKATYGKGSSGFMGTGYAVSSDVAGAFTNPELEIVNYYDNYDFIGRNLGGAVPSVTVSDSQKQHAVGFQTGQVVYATNGEALGSVNVYDQKGQIVRSVRKGLKGYLEDVGTAYTFTGSVDNTMADVDVRYGSHFTAETAYSYEYGKKTSMTLSVSHGMAASSRETEYTYDAIGRLSGKQRQTYGTKKSSCSYTYDVHGWLTSITNGLFQESLCYADGLDGGCYNGNISTARWKTGSSSSYQGYNLKYDDSNRLYSAVFGDGDNLAVAQNYFNENVEYDCNGNITRLRRSGLVDNIHGGFGLVDNLSMTYEGNMLTSVRDNASRMAYAGATDFDGVSGQEYPLTYNDAGSLVSDAGRRIARIDYDLRNNPVRIQFTNGSVTKYVYSAAGEKLRVTHYTAVPNISVAIGSTRELAFYEIQYRDSTDYLLGGSLTLKNGRIDKYQFDEGYCQAMMNTSNTSQDDFLFYYYDRDHLGNIRQVVKADRSTNGTVVQTMNYYPFGAQFCNGSADSNVQSRRYNGKEYDRMHGLNTYDYGARQYNPIVGRWDRVDPLCEKYYSISPYAYCHNNPAMFVDPDGNSPLSALIKATAKQGVKAGIKSYVKNNIERRLKNYMSKDMLKQFAKDADDVMGTLDNSWWENALELVPVAGDIYGSTKFVKQVTKAYDKLQDLENKYVGEIYKSLPKGQRDKFVKNMRSKGVADARKDQAKGLDVGGDVKYEKGGKTDGHHTEKVSENPDKMTDPRTIEFKKQEDHIKYHQQNGY